MMPATARAASPVRDIFLHRCLLEDTVPCPAIIRPVLVAMNAESSVAFLLLHGDPHRREYDWRRVDRIHLLH